LCPTSTIENFNHGDESPFPYLPDAMILLTASSQNRFILAFISPPKGAD
jgi:hypothetical protein